MSRPSSKSAAASTRNRTVRYIGNNPCMRLPPARQPADSDERPASHELCPLPAFTRSTQASSCAESSERPLLRVPAPTSRGHRSTRSGRSISRDAAAAAPPPPRKKRPRVAPPDAAPFRAREPVAPAATDADARERARDDRRAATAAAAPVGARARDADVPPPSLPWRDDPDGHLVFKLGDGLFPSDEYPNGRYKILSALGEGTFGKVVECWDRRQCRRVAVKIVRSITKYREAARLEIDVLVHLSFHDPDGVFHCVKLYSWFEHLSHVCMVFEKLGPSLYEHLRKKRFQPFSIDEVRAYAFQLLESVSFVHSLTLIHTDLKPENILLLDKDNPQSIKLIDFGSATFDHQHHSTVVSTRHYRAPEVILGLGWTYPCDLWSVGCILVELYTGQALFQTHENLEHLAMMSVVLGPIPQAMIHRAHSSSREYFRTKKGGAVALNWPGGATSKASLRSVRRVKRLADIVRDGDGASHFLDLLRRLLAFEPETRCTSEEALSHPFFNELPAHANPVESDYPPTSMTHSSGSSACAPTPRSLAAAASSAADAVRPPARDRRAKRTRARVAPPATSLAVGNDGGDDGGDDGVGRPKPAALSRRRRRSRNADSRD